MHVHRKYTHLAWAGPGPAHVDICRCVYFLCTCVYFIFLYIFTCTRSIEQMGCSNKPLSKSDRGLSMQPVCALFIQTYSSARLIISGKPSKPGAFAEANKFRVRSKHKSDSWKWIPAKWQLSHTGMGPPARPPGPWAHGPMSWDAWAPWVPWAHEPMGPWVHIYIYICYVFCPLPILHGMRACTRFRPLERAPALWEQLHNPQCHTDRWPPNSNLANLVIYGVFIKTSTFCYTNGHPNQYIPVDTIFNYRSHLYIPVDTIFNYRSHFGLPGKCL